MSWCIASTDTAQWETVLWHKPSVNNSANLMRKWSKTLLKILILMLSNQFFFFATCSVCTYFFHLRLPNSGKSWVLVQTLFTCCRNKRLRTTQTTRKPFTAFLFFCPYFFSIFAFGERCILYLSFSSSSGLFFCFVLFCYRDWVGYSTQNVLSCDTCDSKKSTSLLEVVRVRGWGCDIGYKKTA